MGKHSKRQRRIREADQELARREAELNRRTAELELLARSASVEPEYVPPAAPPRRGVSETGAFSVPRDVDNLGPLPLYKPPPGVVPEAEQASTLMAFDSDLEGVYGYAGSNYATSNYGPLAAGQVFQGYPYLSSLAQRSEFRLVASTLSREMTRKWIKFTSTSIEGDRTDRIAAITKAFDRFHVKELFRKVAEHDCFYGRSSIYLDTGHSDDHDELQTPLFLHPAKIPQGGLKRIRAIEPYWSYPADYNARDPLSKDFYSPSMWWVLGRKVHKTRLLNVVGREVPDMLKPTYMFGGMSMSQMLEPYVDNWLRTRQSVSDLLDSFSTMVFSTDMTGTLNGGDGADVRNRVQLYNAYRTNRGTFVLNKDTEALSNVSAPLGTLDKLQAQAQEQMASVATTPLVKLLGITPSGLNASSAGEEEAFDDTMHSYQEHLFRAPLTTILHVIQLSEFGNIDYSIGFEFLPLTQMTEEQQAAQRKTKADMANSYISAGVLEASEERERLAREEGGDYNGLDLSITPQPPGQEAGDPGEGGPDDGPPEAEGGGEPGGGGDGSGGGDDGSGDVPEEAPGDPFQAHDRAITPVPAMDAAKAMPFTKKEWDEAKHTRDSGGKFAPHAGGGPKTSDIIQHALNPKNFSSAQTQKYLQTHHANIEKAKAHPMDPLGALKGLKEKLPVNNYNNKMHFYLDHLIKEHKGMGDKEEKPDQKPKSEYSFAGMSDDYIQTELHSLYGSMENGDSDEASAAAEKALAIKPDPDWDEEHLHMVENITELAHAVQEDNGEDDEEGKDAYHYDKPDRDDEDDEDGDDPYGAESNDVDPTEGKSEELAVKVMASLKHDMDNGDHDAAVSASKIVPQGGWSNAAQQQAAELQAMGHDMVKAKSHDDEAEGQKDDDPNHGEGEEDEGNPHHAQDLEDLQALQVGLNSDDADSAETADNMEINQSWPDTTKEFAKSLKEQAALWLESHAEGGEGDPEYDEQDDDVPFYTYDDESDDDSGEKGIMDGLSHAEVSTKLDQLSEAINKGDKQAIWDASVIGVEDSWPSELKHKAESVIDMALSNMNEGSGNPSHADESDDPGQGDSVDVMEGLSHSEIDAKLDQLSDAIDKGDEDATTQAGSFEVKTHWPKELKDKAGDLIDKALYAEHKAPDAKQQAPAEAPEWTSTPGGVNAQGVLKTVKNALGWTDPDLKAEIESSLAKWDKGDWAGVLAEPNYQTDSVSSQEKNMAFAQAGMKAHAQAKLDAQSKTQVPDAGQQAPAASEPEAAAGPDDDYSFLKPPKPQNHDDQDAVDILEQAQKDVHEGNLGAIHDFIKMGSVGLSPAMVSAVKNAQTIAQTKLSDLGHDVPMPGDHEPLASTAIDHATMDDLIAKMYKGDKEATAKLAAATSANIPPAFHSMLKQMQTKANAILGSEPGKVSPPSESLDVPATQATPDGDYKFPNSEGLAKNKIDILAHDMLQQAQQDVKDGNIVKMNNFVKWGSSAGLSPSMAKVFEDSMAVAATKLKDLGAPVPKNAVTSGTGAAPPSAVLSSPVPIPKEAIEAKNALVSDMGQLPPHDNAQMHNNLSKLHQLMYDTETTKGDKIAAISIHPGYANEDSNQKKEFNKYLNAVKKAYGLPPFVPGKTWGAAPAAAPAKVSVPPEVHAIKQDIMDNIDHLTPENKVKMLEKLTPLASTLDAPVSDNIKKATIEKMQGYEPANSVSKKNFNSYLDGVKQAYGIPATPEATPETAPPTAYKQTAAAVQASAGYTPTPTQASGIAKIKTAKHKSVEASHTYEDSNGNDVQSIQKSTSKNIPDNFYAEVTAAFDGNHAHTEDGEQDYPVLKALEKYQEHTWSKLSSNQKIASQQYQNSQFDPINKHFSLGKELSPKGKQTAALLKKAIRSTFVPTDMPVYRGLRCNLKDLTGFDGHEDAAGRCFEHKNFASVSHSRQSSMNFSSSYAKEAPSGHMTLMKFTLPAGTQAHMMPGQQYGEKEMVLDTNSVFRIDKVEENAEGHRYLVHCTYLGRRADAEE